jgi:hypothetical protein
MYSLEMSMGPNVRVALKIIKLKGPSRDRRVPAPNIRIETRPRGRIFRFLNDREKGPTLVFD